MLITYEVVTDQIEILFSAVNVIDLLWFFFPPMYIALVVFKFLICGVYAKYTTSVELRIIVKVMSRLYTVHCTNKQERVQFCFVFSFQSLLF